MRVIKASDWTAEGHATVGEFSATSHVLPDDSADLFFTDPPYYDAVPYADLSDFFYVFLKRMLREVHPSLFEADLTPKRGEIVQLAERNPIYAFKTKEYFEDGMRDALTEGRRITVPGGLGVVVFAHKTTIGWEVMLASLIDAGWVITGSWPIDTERAVRLRATGSAALASSVHLICRPRENEDGSLRAEIGDWRDVLRELPGRIHSWMPRLSEEGVVGADAIFACLGPALEVFSRYSHVEKTDGTRVELREYLEHVWAAVSREALMMVFEGADASGFEEDARLTAMWLWTLSTGQLVDNGNDEGAVIHSTGYVLDYDSARKIAQGLGVHTEGLAGVVEVKGDKARLLPVSERARTLFGKEEAAVVSPRGKGKAKPNQTDLFEELKEVAGNGDWALTGAPELGVTILDRVHQGMILFAAGRGEALKRFLVEEGAGNDSRFWGLAQALSALYPPQTDEKRWVDGLLARKKGLGL